MRAASTLLVSTLLFGCPTDGPGPGPGTCTDRDGDGACASEDCNDEDATIGPDAPELCNLLDDNCNGGLPDDELIDDDLDGDPVCSDCDDADGSRFRGNTEACNLIDDDCDGLIPEDEQDTDGDGWPGCNECNDDDDAVHHDAEEICDGLDDDCDGVLPPDEEDPDGDGFLECNGDCDPHRDTVAPGFPEICDGMDSDCDGNLGEAGGTDVDWDGLVPESEATDGDSDGYVACADCDDADPNRRPGAEEVCNGWDDNCDGGLFFDEVAGNGKTTDDDGDGWSPCLGDCDDNEALAHPENWEFLTDGVDNDCDGTGDNQPGWAPMDRPEADMLAELQGLCVANGTFPVTLGFDSGPDGAVFPSTGPLVLAAEDSSGGAVGFHFENNLDGLLPRNGSFFLVSDAPVAWLRMEWDAPQGSVFGGLAGPVGNGSGWQASFSWNGTALGAATWFGAVPLQSGWNLRGTSVFGNVAWDAVEITVDGPALVLALDDWSSCQ
jgi:hypothetical protein